MGSVRYNKIKTIIKEIEPMKQLSFSITGSFHAAEGYAAFGNLMLSKLRILPARG